MNSYIDARLIQSRLVNERVSSPSAKFSNEPAQVQLRTDASSAFVVGVNDAEKPDEFIVEIDYKATLRVEGTTQQLADYESKYAAAFRVVSWTGFADWTKIPPAAVAPYLAFVHNFAMRRAETTFSAMGMRGLVLPQPKDFLSPDSASPEISPEGQSST